MTTTGIACLSEGICAGVTTGYTHLTTANSVDTNGTLISWCVKVCGDGKAQLKIFRDDGTNYVFIGESSHLNVVDGWNNGLSCNISVEAGDLIGVYIETCSAASVSLYYGYYYKGNISDNTLKSSWGYNHDNTPAIGASDVSTPLCDFTVT